MKPPTWLVALNLLFAALFLISAALQHNDPDPLRWVALYVGAAVATLLAVHTPRGWLAAAAVLAVAAVWAGLCWSQVLGDVALTDLWRKMSEKGGKVEVMREAGGLTIVAAWLALATSMGWRRARARAVTSAAP